MLIQIKIILKEKQPFSFFCLSQLTPNYITVKEFLRNASRKKETILFLLCTFSSCYKHFNNLYIELCFILSILLTAVSSIYRHAVI